jgi:predicted lipoprotein with Yx(FWY)xxD motif
MARHAQQTAGRNWATRSFRVRHVTTTLVVATAGCVLAACSGDTTPRANAPRHESQGQVVLYAMPTNLGRIVTLPYGSPVYVDTKEGADSGTGCTGSCAKVWVPVLTAQTPKATTGLESSEIGTADYGGSKQVTYFGHRLYYDKHDTHPLVATGQGSAGTWYVILPSGQVLQQS